MEPLPRPIRALVVPALALCAAFGFYLGASRSWSETTPGYAATDESGNARVASATAIAPPPAPTLDEAAVRRIAKEEAQTLVARAAPAASPAPRHRSSSSEPRSASTPSDAGIVYAKPPLAPDGPPPPAAGGAPPPGQLEQF